MFSAIETILLLMAASVLAVVVFRMVRLPPMLGYLMVGVLMGPYAFGISQYDETMRRLGEFGVVFLMFSIGLEFSQAKLSTMRRTVFGLGMMQVLLTAVMIMLVIWVVQLFKQKLIGLSWQAILVLGGALAMSSTAVVSKLLSDRMELESEHGRYVMGILLFQDLALVPLLILAPAFANKGENLIVTLAWATFNASWVMIVLLFVGQKMMRGWFRIVLKRRSQELFTLNVLLMTLTAAWATESVGLSPALGAFVVGMLIAETEFKYQVEDDIKPFRDVLLGLFFITIGMLLDVRLLWMYWEWIVACLLVFTILKFCVVFVLAKWMEGSSTGTALRTGLGLAQAGEFGFVLLNQMGALNMMNPLFVHIILATMVLSMFLTPFIFAQTNAIVMRFSSSEWMAQSVALTHIASRTIGISRHLIIAGFGRSGQSLAKLLEEEGVPYYALDLDAERVQAAQAAGAHVSYGNATNRESLIAAGIQRAAALVITYPETHAALKVLHFVRDLAPNLPVIVRSHDDTDLDLLKNAGATEVVPEAIEGNLMLASHALVMLGVPLRRVVHRVQRARDERYSSLRGYFRGRDDPHRGDDHIQIRLFSVILSGDANAIGKKISELNLAETGAEINMIRRGRRRVDIFDDRVLHANDVVVLRGSSEAVALAENRLLMGATILS